jgi:hypothetical protein
LKLIKELLAVGQHGLNDATLLSHVRDHGHHTRSGPKMARGRERDRQKETDRQKTTFVYQRQ